jgi:hypothetical protein
MPYADDQRQVAALLEATAAELLPLMVDLAAFHRPDVWTGRRADRFGREIEDRHRQLRVTADDLRRQARELLVRADPIDLRIGPDLGP